MERDRVIMQGTSLVNARRKPSKQFGIGRKCKKWGCQTILSRYNSEEFCSIHTFSYVETANV